jgi:hypothetical protein
MPPVVFERTISAGEWSQTYSLDRVATAGTGTNKIVKTVKLQEDENERKYTKRMRSENYMKNLFHKR